MVYLLLLLFQKLVQCFQAGHWTALHHVTLLSTNSKTSVTTAVLSNTRVLGRTLISWYVPRQRLTERTVQHLAPYCALINTQQFILHDLPSQDLRYGQNVKFDLRFGQKPFSNFTGLLLCYYVLASKPSVMLENWTQQHATR